MIPYAAPKLQFHTDTGAGQQHPLPGSLREMEPVCMTFIMK
jgi:hypothetical protein